MTKEFALNQAFKRILKTATTLEEVKSLYYQAHAEIYPFDFELEQADRQREMMFDFNNVIAEGEKVGA